RTLVRSEAGIVLEPGKEYLVEARLGPLARREQLAGPSELIAALGRLRGPLHTRVVEAMTTNETIFFRDVEPFEVLKREVLPAVIQARQATRRLQVWCGAASTGQEPYSIAMTLLEQPALASWTIDILATDISTDVLAKARAGKYSQLEVNRGLPATHLVKYFTKQGLEWQLNDRIRSMVRFEQLNLMRPLPSMAAPDIVFLRNVLIYFDAADKSAILGRVRAVMRQDGFLFLGAAESPRNLDDRFERLPFSKTGCYRISPEARPALRALA
ncbi:MAG TPA: protein-glutamate O-methyltransferase CheR, partial [Luteitalea sp.]|nr:protein-glutamate O-methyltransferase CheR [Luteitalea sp.]